MPSQYWEHQARKQEAEEDRIADAVVEKLKSQGLVLTQGNLKKMMDAVAKDRAEGPPHTDPEKDHPVTAHPDQSVQRNLEAIQATAAEKTEIPQDELAFERRQILEWDQHLTKVMLAENFGPEGHVAQILTKDDVHRNAPICKAFRKIVHYCKLQKNLGPR